MFACVGTTASSVLALPTVTLDATTNYNQNLATLNSTVDGRGYSTAVTVQYSSNGGSTWSTAETMTGSPVYSSTSLYRNVTGLSVGTAYIVKVTATHAKGSTVVQNSSGNFTTWSLQTYTKTTSGSFTVSVPSVTPTGGSAIAPSIYEMLIYGGGGAAAHGGGGGGGYRLAASATSSVTGTQNVTGSIGAGGTNPTNAIPAPSGGNSTITLGGTTWTAGGGSGGNNFTSAAGTVGTGDNPAYGGGSGYYGYTYFTGSYVQYVCGYEQYCCALSKNGACIQYCDDTSRPIYCNDYNQPIYATDYSRYSGGGGGGTDAGGASATYPDQGGAGGAGGGAYGLRGGNGGGGGGTASTGAAGSVPSGSGSIVGTGGTGFWASGVAGGVTFKYYGP